MTQQSPTFGTQRSVELTGATKFNESAAEKEAKDAIESEMEVIAEYKQLLENERNANKQAKELYEQTVA